MLSSPKVTNVHYKSAKRSRQNQLRERERERSYDTQWVSLHDIWG